MREFWIADLGLSHITKRWEERVAGHGIADLYQNSTMTI
jgi:hypothetical protein